MVVGSWAAKMPAPSAKQSMLLLSPDPSHLLLRASHVAWSYLQGRSDIQRGGPMGTASIKAIEDPEVGAKCQAQLVLSNPKVVGPRAVRLYIPSVQVHEGQWETCCHVLPERCFPMHSAHARDAQFNMISYQTYTAEASIEARAAPACINQQVHISVLSLAMSPLSCRWQVH